MFAVLDNFVLTAQGKPNIDWWNSICTRIPGGSGPSYLDGWLTVFCVFNEKGVWQVEDRCYSYNAPSSKTDYFFLESDDIPNGYTSVPIKYDDHGVIYETTLVVGHLSSTIKDNNTIQPNLSWFLMINE